MNSDVLKTPVSRFVSTHRINHDSPCLKIPASPLLTTLGYGTGVNVYLVERSPRHGNLRSPWAIKKISKAAHSKKLYSERLKSEGDILKSLCHDNIVGFRALIKSGDGTLCLALEDGHKSLYSIIEQRIDDELDAFPSHNIMKMASDVANALYYLHDTKRLLHGDIKSANVLIKGDFDVAKLCDFGVSIKLNDSMSAPSSDYVGTESWSSKEALGKGVVTDKSDMYSYGLTIFEMLTLNIPHFNFPNEDEFENDDDFTAACEDVEVMAVKNFGTRPALPNHAFTKEYHRVIEVFFICCDENPKMRPSASQVRKLFATEIQRTLNFE